MVFASMLFIWLFLPVTLVLYYLLSLTKKMKVGGKTEPCVA